MLSFVTILRNKWNLICLKGEMKVLFHVFEHSLSSTSSSLMQKTQRTTKQKRTISTSDSAWINKLISHSLFVVENKKARCKSITRAKWYVLVISNILILIPIHIFKPKVLFGMFSIKHVKGLVSINQFSFIVHFW